MEIEPVYLSSKSCALLAQPTCLKRRSFNFGARHSLFPVCGARFTVPLMLGQWSASVCRQFGVVPSDYGQPWQTATKAIPRRFSVQRNIPLCNQLHLATCQPVGEYSGGLKLSFRLTRIICKNYDLIISTFRNVL